MYILAYVMALFVAMPFHEFAHAFAAKREGDYTAVALKRYTLAPLAHIDIKGLVFLLFFRFGWAKPVPVDSRNFKRGNLSKFLVSIAGIVTNLALGTIFLFIYFLIFKISPNLYTSNLYGELLYLFLQLSVTLNFSLAFFNLLPIYPLDGYKIVESILKWDSKVVEFLKNYSFIIYIALIVTGIYSYYFYYTAGTLISLLEKLFIMILGV
jgi:Zn-dependent protease